MGGSISNSSTEGITRGISKESSPPLAQREPRIILIELQIETLIKSFMLCITHILNLRLILILI